MEFWLTFVYSHHRFYTLSRIRTLKHPVRRISKRTFQPRDSFAWNSYYRKGFQGTVVGEPAGIMEGTMVTQKTPGEKYNHTERANTGVSRRARKGRTRGSGEFRNGVHRRQYTGTGLPLLPCPSHCARGVINGDATLYCPPVCPLR